MAENASVFQGVQLGVESVSGTQVPAIRRLAALSIEQTPNEPIIPFRPMGSKYPTLTMKQKGHAEAAITGNQSFSDLVYPFSGLFGNAAITTPGGGTLSRQWLWLPKTRITDDPRTFTVESGSVDGAQLMTYGLFNSLTLRWSAEEASVQGAMLGRLLQEGITLTTGINEVQQVTKGTNTGGTFTLTYSGQTTAAIAWNAAAATVQAALEALSNIGVGDVLVTGAAGGPWTVTFDGALGDLDVALMTIDGSSLTGGSGHAVTLVTAGQPLTSIDPVPVDADTVSVYVADTLGGLSAGQLLRCYEVEVAWANKFALQKTLDASQGSFSAHVERAPDFTATIQLQHDAVSRGFMTNLRAKTKRYCRIISTGPLIEGSINYLLQITFPFNFRDPARGDRNDVYTGTYGLVPLDDSTLGGSAEIKLINTLTAL